MNLFGQDGKLPQTWDKDFVITGSYKSSMGGGSTEIRITYEECTYMSSSSRTGKMENRKFAMTEEKRLKVLKKMHDLHVDNISSNNKFTPQRDGWSNSICFGERCIEGGSAMEMSEQDKNTFLDAYRFIEQFASGKR